MMPVELSEEDREVETRRDYLAQFASMETSEDVMSYKWPTQASPVFDDEVEKADRWYPMDHPPITTAAPPAILSVAHLRKNTITHVKKNTFVESVRSGCTGNGTPGLTGFGLTRNKPRSYADGVNYSVGSRADPLPSNTSSRSGEEGRSAPLRSIPGGGRLAPLNSPSVDSGSIDEQEDSISKGVLKLLGTLLQPKKKDEDYFKDVFRACLPPGSPDPFVVVPDEEKEAASTDTSRLPTRASFNAGVSAEGGPRASLSRGGSRGGGPRGGVHRRASVVMSEEREAAAKAEALAEAKAAVEVAWRQKVSATDLLRAVLDCPLEPQGGGGAESTPVGLAVSRTSALRALREQPVLQEALLNLEVPKLEDGEDEEGWGNDPGLGSRDGFQRMLGRWEWIVFCEALQDLTHWNESVM